MGWGMLIQEELRSEILPEHPQNPSSLDPMLSTEIPARPTPQTCQFHPVDHFLGPKLKY